MTGMSQLRGNSKSSLAKKETNQKTRAVLNRYRNLVHRRCWRPRHVDSLNAGDVEGHGAQHDLRPHAVDGCSHGQVHLPAEGEMRGGTQVCQRLQGLCRTRRTTLNQSKTRASTKKLLKTNFTFTMMG